MQLNIHNNCKRVILHICRNPGTGVWAMMQSLCLEQNRNEAQFAALAILAPKTWNDSALTALKSKQIPFLFKRVPFRSATVAHLMFILHNPLRNWVNQIRKSAPHAEIVLHFHSAWLTGGFLPLPGTEGIGIVATFHGIADEHRLKNIWWLRTLHTFLARRLWRSKATLTAVSRKTTVMAEEIFGIPRGTFVVVPNGLSTARPAVSLPRRSDQLVVGHIGQMHHGKGWHLLLEAVDRLHARGIPIKLILAGAGMDNNLAQEAASSRKDYVEYLGYVENAGERVTPGLDVLVLASWTEGMPMGIIEAFAAGVAVLATPVGGIPEMVEDGVNGLWIERSAVSIENALLSLHENSDLLQTLKEGGRQSFATKFNIENVLAQYDLAYSASLIPQD